MCVGVLGSRGCEGTATEELGSVLVVDYVIALCFEAVELRPELPEVGAEVAQSLEGFLLLRWVELLFC